MTLIRAITDAALRRSQILATDQEATGAEASEALERLNDYLSSRSAYGLVLTDANGDDYTHAALALNDTWPLEESFVRGMKAILATRLAEDYGSPVTPQLAMDAREGERAFAIAFAPATTATMPRALRGYERCR